MMKHIKIFLMGILPVLIIVVLTITAFVILFGPMLLADVLKSPWPVIIQMGLVVSSIIYITGLELYNKRH